MNKKTIEMGDVLVTVTANAGEKLLYIDVHNRESNQEIVYLSFAKDSAIDFGKLLIDFADGLLPMESLDCER